MAKSGLSFSKSLVSISQFWAH